MIPRPPSVALRPFPLFRGLEARPADGHLSLMALHQADIRTKKLDLGVGVYRDETGATPVFRAVREAERSLLENQDSKGYLGLAGDEEFIERLKPIVFGKLARSRLLIGVQTPGGTGGLRLAAELIADAKADAQVWIGAPGWPNHWPIMAAAGLKTMTFDYFDRAEQTVRYDKMMSALSFARAGDVVVLQGCCHNPTGADLRPAEWTALADLMAERGLVPLFDMAHQGFGTGLEDDAQGLRIVCNRVGEALVAYSCDKNFGLYRERTGALFALGGTQAAAATVRSNLLALARASWSMPPAHGAAIVRTVLASEALIRDWEAELAVMRHRVAEIRTALARGTPRFAPLAGQRGLFSLLQLQPEHVVDLRERQGIYLTEAGRINVAGLTEKTIDRFKRAVAIYFRAADRAQQQPILLSQTGRR